jgi:hypothetical protein
MITNSASPAISKSILLTIAFAIVALSPSAVLKRRNPASILLSR